MKKLFALGLMAILPLASCNNKQQDSGYKTTTLENFIIAFLESRGVSGVERVEPLHYIDYNDIDYLTFHEETEDDYACLEARLSQSNIENELLDSFSTYNWFIPGAPTEYGWEITDPDLKMEIDVLFDDDEDYYGTWIYVYSYVDLYGEPVDITELESDIITFLESRDVYDYTSIDPLHFIEDKDVTEKKFVEEGETNAARFEAKISQVDIESQLIASFEEYGWSVPETKSEYGWECVDPYELVEIDFYYTSISGYIGTWIKVYAYADISGGDDAVDIGDALSVTFSALGLENATEYPLFTGDYIYIEFGEGTQETCKYYTSGTSIRIYAGASVTIGSSTSRNIAKIEYTWGGETRRPNGDYTVSAANYNADTATWTGNASEVTLTRSSGSGHWRLQSVTVTLA